MILPFNKLPGYNSIFLDYINNFEKLASFFESDYRAKEDYLNTIRNKQENYLRDKDFTRDTIADILKKQNEFFNSSGKTFENIELLRKDNTYAIVTGQQLGMLTGNYYTVIKALNSIQLAERLSIQYPEYNFIPIFWLEADDHDFLEVNHINIFNQENQIVGIKYFENGVEEEKYLKPVGSLLFDETIQQFKNELRSSLQDTDFKESILNYVDESYKQGESFITAFTRFMNKIIKDSGLIFINPTDKDFKRILIPVFEKELNTYPASCEIAVDTSAKIERNYEPQVKPRPINIFYIHNSNRYLVEPRPEEIFALKNSRKKFSKSELFDILYSSPERFSSNVMLRPICQDYLLPTIAYIGGPSEVAYFAQFKGVYEFFNIKMPVIYPRTSATLLESKVKNFLTKYALKFEELFDAKQVSEKLLRQMGNVNVDELFDRYVDELNALGYDFEKEIEKIDKNLINSFKNKSERYIDTVNMLKGKFVDSQITQNKASIEKLRSVMRNVNPDENLQERFINIVYFLNKYSLELIGYLKDNLEIDNFAHQILDLNIEPL